jgi:hypothetical protein
MKNKKNINRWVSKVLKETFDNKIDKLTSKIKSNVNELGGMDDGHPIFGDLNMGKMSSKEIRDLMSKHYGKKNDNDDDINMRDMDDEFEEMKEGFDDLETKNARKRVDYSQEEFKPIPTDKINYSNLDDDSSTIHNFLKNQLRNRRNTEDSDELYESSEVCECGGGMYEGECMECGTKMEGIYDVDDIDNKNKFDYTQEEKDFDYTEEKHSPIVRPNPNKKYGNEKPYSFSKSSSKPPELKPRIREDEDFDGEETFSSEENVGGCKAVRDTIKSKGGEPDGLDLDLIKRYNCESLNESLKGGQKKLDKNRNNRIDSEDFKLLRKTKSKKTETKEGKKFPDLSGDGKVTKKDVLLGRGVKLKNGKSKVKESISLTEDEMIDLIEKIVKEQKTFGKPKGLEAYEKAHKGSGKENQDYLKSVTKKMKDYLKDGSKGEYSASPKHFPKGNGELAKMDKKAYEVSKDGEEFLDNYMRPGMENLDYDEIHPNEDWMKDNIEGSSKTGNNPKWANAEETELGAKINKKRKENKLAKAKRAAYNKSAQPVVTDKPGQESGKGLDIKVESIESKKTIKLNEEFEKMKSLISYDRKTQ